MPEEFECQCDAEICEGIQGNEVELEVKKSDCEIRADIIVGRKHCVRLWGQVIDCEGQPVKDALVTLLRCYFHHGKFEYEGVANTIADCAGFYQFDICTCDEDYTKYKIIVSKATVGKERVISGDGECFPCID